jgi:hypothetical protein
MNKAELTIKIDTSLDLKKLKTKNIWGNKIYQIGEIGDDQFCIVYKNGLWEISYCERGNAMLQYKTEKVDDAITTLLDLISQA